MPHDVKTRWNLTYKMLEFAVKYRDVLDRLLGERDWDMRNYELASGEWRIATQLRDVLKVCFAV